MSETGGQVSEQESRGQGPAVTEEQVAGDQEARKERLRPSIEGFRRQLTAAGADVSTVGDDVLEALITIGSNVLVGGSLPGFIDDWIELQPAFGQASQQGPSYAGPVFPTGPVFPKKAGGNFGQQAPGFGPSPYESFSLGQAPGMAEASVFAWMVQQARERERLKNLFRQVVSGAAVWLADKAHPMANPFTYNNAFPKQPAPWPAQVDVPASGEGF